MKNTKKILMVAVIAAVIALLTGCGLANPFAGKTFEGKTDLLIANTTITMKFKSSEIDITTRQSFGGLGADISWTTDYTFDGSTITFKADKKDSIGTTFNYELDGNNLYFTTIGGLRWATLKRK